MPEFTFDHWPLQATLAHAVPFLFLLGALRTRQTPTTPAAAGALARRVAAATVFVASALLAVGATTAEPWTTARALVLGLIGFVGWVLARFSATYLDGEPGQPRFVRWLLGTLSGSTLVIATGNLAVLVLAWLGTSLALQRLLVFYPHRPAAQMAAHKKFLVSRLADACMTTAVVLLALRFGTVDIDAIVDRCAAGTDLGGPGHAAVVLIAVAALLKSAQLPFHGWLMQVMEAPTPVSALLHAGVVNLGGFVLIRIHPLIAAVPAAQVLLAVAGGLTAALAGLVATTRISIKVALAWSTCAQMGFMLLQCGLGLPEMALLHLLAHSLYKANAFLAAGTAVHHAVVAALLPRPRAVHPVAQLLALALTASLVGSASWAFAVPLAANPPVLAMAGVVALALLPLATHRSHAPGLAPWLWRLAAPAMVALLWFGLHAALHGWLGDNPPPSPLAPALAAWTAACFALVLVVQTVAARWPQASAVQRLHAWFFGGLFLDEWFTRLTLRLWPNRMDRFPEADVPENAPR